ncbi:MAG: transcription elongation factor GreA [Chloroflexota bacterium]|nr:MAG: transcription elongation factor GreA [Chloroflexota bacterium]
MKGAPATLAEAAQRFLATAPLDDRAASQQAINRFVRWFGSDTAVENLTGHDVATFSGAESPSNPDWLHNLEQVKAFLVWCKGQGITPTNLGAHIKVRKPTKKASIRDLREKPVVHLTRDGFAKLQGELSELIAQRPLIADELRRAAADKDFRENAPYHAAREHQGRIEARIREIEATLKVASIIEDNIDASGLSRTNMRIGIGSVVLLHDLTDDEEVRYTLVGPDEADPLRGKLSIASPTGKALLDRTEGDELEVVVPAGTFCYRVLKVEG